MSPLRRVTCLVFVGFEIAFKLVFVRAFGNALARVGDHAWVTELYVQSTVIVGLLWLGVIYLLTVRSDRLVRGDVSAHAVRVQRQLPDQLTVAWAMNWGATLCLVVLRAPYIASVEATICLLLSVLLGSTVLAHTFTSWLVESRLRDAGAGPARRVFGASPRSLRLRLVSYGLGLGLAPTLYLGSLAFAMRENPMDAAQVMMEVLLQAGATAGFALTSAVLISLTIIGPVRQMTLILQNVGAVDDYTALERLPVLRNDEIGALSEATNLMLDRLERSDRERLALYATLEHKVEERTAALRDANAQIACDFESRSRMELELRQAQRLEAVGRLAAGIAHEINTPLQFVSDSLQFVRAGTADVLELAASRGGVTDETVDLPYLRDHLPQAIERALDGLGRVTTIVRSMKAFAHPDRSAPAEVDLNQTITSTLMIARNEYKYVADLETHFGELPRVTCWVGDFNQVIVNLVVNAAHAIGDVVGTSGAKGRIAVTTRCDGADVVVEIADTGGGIPESARDYVFEPFFTTKEIGKGTGQGLAIARAVIVDKHQGSIDFDSVVGVGTTFKIRIPIEGAATSNAA